MGHLQHVWEQYKDKGVVVLGFNSADDPEIAREFLATRNVSFQNILDNSRVARNVASIDYQGFSVPLNYVIDRRGRVAAAFSGFGRRDRRGVEALERVLAGMTEYGENVQEEAAPAALSGTVVGPDGQPLPFAFVRLLPSTEDWRRGNRIVGARASGEGHFSLEELKEGVWEMQVQIVGDENWVAPVGKLRWRGGAARKLELKVLDSRLEGTITRADTGAAMRPREVQITATPVEVEGGVVQARLGTSTMAFADENGRYVFVGLKPGHYEIWIHSFLDELEGTKQIVELKDNRLQGVDIVLQKKE